MDKDIQQLRTDLSAAFTKFCHAANHLTPSLRRKPGVTGKWSPIEVVAHLIGWDQLFHDFIVDPDEFDPPIDVNQFNAQTVASFKGLIWEELMQELETSFHGLEQALTTVRSDSEIYPRVMMWLQGRIEDYELHTEQLTEWHK